MTYGQLDNELRRLLAPLEEGRREGRILLEETCAIPAGQFPLWQEREIPPELEDRCRSLARRRLEGEPLQYLLGRWEFFGLPFWVGPGVLIPRPETELLVETGLALLQGVDRPLAADLCAGSGCIAASLAHSLPSCRVTAVEWSREAFPYLERNLAANAAGQATAVRGDVLQPDRCPAPAQGPFHLILSNPPYIPTGDLPGLQREVRREPAMALDGGADGLSFYRVLAREWSRRLLPGGWLAVEIGWDQGEAVSRLFADGGLEEIRVHKDLSGLDRVVAGRRPAAPSQSPFPSEKTENCR